MARYPPRDIPISAVGYIPQTILCPTSMYSWLTSIVPSGADVIIINDENNYQQSINSLIELNLYNLLGYAIYNEIIENTSFNIQQVEYNPNTRDNIQEIVDNGEGFTDTRYDKFCELLKVEEDTHKGVGRLVYLSYFDKIEVSSYFDGKHRTFTFNDEFDKEKTDMQLSEDVGGKQETKLTFKDCSLQRLSSNSVITPDYLHRQILLEFYPRLYLLKKEGKDFKISFKIEIPHKHKKHFVGAYEREISKTDIPDMTTTELNTDVVEMFEKTNLDYAVRKNDVPSETFLMTALCVDNRTQVLDDIISLENLPKTGYTIVFILRSRYSYRSTAV